MVRVVPPAPLERMIKEIVPWVFCMCNEMPRFYQRRLLKALVSRKRVAIRWPRQCGKTTVVGWFCMYICLMVAESSIIVVAPALRQSGEFFQRVLTIVDKSKLLQSMVVAQSKTEIRFANGSVFKCVPCGHDGKTIKGQTCDIVIIEEAGYMKDSIVNQTILPFIASKGDKGQIIKLGTPFGKTSFYDSCCKDPNYYASHITWRDVLAEGGYSINYLKEQKRNMTELEFRTEYEAEFIEDADCYFKTEVISGAIEDYPMIAGAIIYS